MRAAIVLMLAAAAAACDDPTGVSLPGDYFVSATSGSDTYDGSSGAPFKTISKALSVADSGDTIVVAPGRYDAALGETFPLQIPAWVELIGDEPNKGGGTTPTLIFGGAATGNGLIGAALEPGAHATIAGFTVTDSASVQNPSAIVIRNDSVTVRNNRLINGADVAIVATDSSVGSVIRGNVVSGNTYGIIFGGGGVGSRVESNSITANIHGVYYDGTGGDLGGGAAGSTGGNTLSCNTGNDLYLDAAVTVSATGNQWDHAPPTTGATGDIFDNSGGATVTATGATVAAGACT